MTTNLQTGYRSLFPLAFAAVLGSVALAVVDGVAAFASAGRIQLLDAARFGAPLPQAQAEAWDFRLHVIAAVQLAIGVPAAILFLMWVYRANRNARALGAEGMAYSPGWSVGWFFVPVAGMIMPYFVLREIWKTSAGDRRSDWSRVPVSPLLGVWWLACVVHGMFHYEAFHILLGRLDLARGLDHSPWFLQSSMGLDNGTEGSWFLLISNLVGIASELLGCLVMLWITDLQDRGHHREADQTPVSGTGLVESAWPMPE
jgi:hypothetical protein